MKFRVFEDGKMHYCKEGMWWFFGHNGYWSLNDINENIICDNLESENPVLMQYSGKKDSNGIEIYDRDLVDIWQGGKFVFGMVVYDKGLMAWMVVNHNNIANRIGYLSDYEKIIVKGCKYNNGN